MENQQPAYIFACWEDSRKAMKALPLKRKTHHRDQDLNEHRRRSTKIEKKIRDEDHWGKTEIQEEASGLIAVKNWVTYSAS